MYLTMITTVSDLDYSTSGLTHTNTHLNYMDDAALF